MSIDPCTKPSRILIACHAWFGDTIGGSFRLASEFAEHLANSGHNVSYVCCEPATDTPKTETDLGVAVYRYPAPKSGSQFSRFRHHVKRTAALVQQIHANQPLDAVSSHSPLQGLGAAKALRGKVPINYTVHSPFDDELLSNAGDPKPSLIGQLAGRAARWVDGQNVRMAKVVQTASEYTQNNFRTKFGASMTTKGIVAPGWVEMKAFQPADNQESIRQTLGPAWATDTPLFFTLRRLENRMGLDTLIDACKLLKDDGLKFRTLIGGRGRLQESLQRRINDHSLQDHVKLLGRLPEEHLGPAYAAADCFVLPTRALECFGLIVLEALACNTPVIASNVAAIPELASRQGDEWMFAPSDTKQLFDRMASFLDGSLKPTQNLRAIAEEFDKPKILKKWTEILLSKPASR